MDADLAFGFGPHPCRPFAAGVLPSTLSVQVQIRYTKQDGTKFLRIITRELPVTADRSVAEADIDSSVLSVYAIRRSAEFAHKADYLVCPPRQGMVCTSFLWFC